MIENDKRVFKYFKENENDMLSKLNFIELRYFLYYLDKYYLEYRDKLGISKDITFGVEIELEHFKGNVFEIFQFEKDVYKLLGENDWTLKNDITLIHGRELATEVYTDCEKTWNDIKKVCEFSSEYLEVGQRSAGHVNIGSQILGNNALYWYRFLKLWGIYENVIYRFGYGEYLSYFPYMEFGSRPLGEIILNRLDYLKELSNQTAHEFIVKSLPYEKGEPGFLKKNGLSFYKLWEERDYDKVIYDLVIELRNPISTMDTIVWQNYVNFFVHLLLYCKSDKFNEDILDKRMNDIKEIVTSIDNYDNIYTKQALELSDMIFDNNKDKIYFLRQYLKSYEVSSEKFKKAKKFTLSK